MNPPELHLCIATGQNLANLIPALQCGATEVWVLQTPAMKPSASHLSDALRRRGIAVTRIDFADDDIGTLHRQAEWVADSLDGRAVTVNLTGGTKLMTLALVETLAAQLATGGQDTVPHLVYTDTHHQRLDWLKPVPRSEPMQDVLRIDDALFVQGYRRIGGSGGPETARWQRAADARATLTRRMGDEAEALASFFGPLSTVAHRALNEPSGPFLREQQFEYPPGGKAKRLFALAHELNLLHWDASTRVVFNDPEAARYFGGGWVEEYVALKVSGLPQKDWVPNLRIEHVDSRATNELDTVLMYRNRMLVVECKAKSTFAGDVSDWIYKLSQLTRGVGGQLARPLLVSARNLADVHRQRAKEYGVDVLDGERVSTLGSYLRRWMKD